MSEIYSWTTFVFTYVKQELNKVSFTLLVFINRLIFLSFKEKTNTSQLVFFNLLILFPFGISFVEPLL